MAGLAHTSLPAWARESIIASEIAHAIINCIERCTNLKDIALKNWEQFEEHISSFFIEKEKLKILKKPLYVSTPLFRGQANASWELETTLDRMVKRDFGMEEYFKALRAVRPAVISITGKEWEFPNDFDDEVFVPQGYEFMVYLRHHGFPSPLLDWTRSPFVAAYFAFRSFDESKEGKVAIYSYVEYLGGAKAYSSSVPSIHGLGPYVVSHKRHYAQQCEYTICKKMTGGEYVYTSHKGAIAQGESDQDELVKYTLPTSEKGNVLRKLELMNVTALSLFGSEESLMETLAYQEIGKKIWL